MLRETGAIVALNLSSLGGRIGASAIIVVGIGGVVAVLLALLAMSAGFRTALVETAQPDRVLVVRSGSNNEMDGWVTNEQLALLEAMAGFTVVSGEIYVAISVPTRGSHTAADVVGRGVTPAAFALRPEMNIVAGRMFEPGTDEIVVGIGAARQYEGLQVGDRVAARNTTFVVVGHFAAGGTAVESEIWMDRVIAQNVFRREASVSVARARLRSGHDAAAMATRIADDARLPLTLVGEPEFYARQSASRAALIDAFAYFIAGIMALGAVTAALNTMYTAVNRRTVEIATLRAIGFSNASVVLSVIVEAMLLALLGGIIGALLVHLTLNGYIASTLNTAAGSQLAFAFRLTPGLAAMGLAWALALGLIGGLLPAMQAARLPISRALRRA